MSADPESDPADVAEQQRPVLPDPDDDEAREMPLEADPADVAEQWGDAPLEDADELG